MSVSIRDQERYYTNRWSSFACANRLEMARIAKVLELLATVEFRDTPKICDLGCGAGWSSNILRTFGAVVGVDLSDVSACKIRYPHCEFMSQNIIEWDPPESEFDAVVSMEVLEHITYPDQERLILNARKMLKPNGCLVLTTPNKLAMDHISGGGRTWSNQPVEDWLNASQLKQLVRRSGFKLRRMTSVVLDVPNGGIYRIINSGKIRRITELLGVSAQWTQVALSANFGLHLVVLAVKQ